MIPLLLIEDQVELCEILKDTLSIYGFEVTYALNGDNGFRLFRSLDPAILIIDIMMPGSDGFSAVKHIREVNKSVPILMLTAKPLTEDLVKAFDLGCNDFMRKPFAMEELIARLKSLTRSTGHVQSPHHNIYRLGSFSFNASTQELVNDTNRFQLSHKEVELLKTLCEAKSTIVDRQVLLSELWGSDNLFNSKTMNVYINRLRNYLESDKSVEILTIRGLGYKLVEKW